MDNDVSFIFLNKLKRFLGKIEADNPTVSNNEIMIYNFTVLKIGLS